MLIQFNQLLARIRNKSTKSDETGFTLVELIIVILIIGILAAIAIPIFMNQQKAAFAAGIQSDVHNTTTQVASWLTKNPSSNDISSAPRVVTKGTIMKISGTWDNYTVIGNNTDNSVCYKFESSTGKTTSCVPTSPPPSNSVTAPSASDKTAIAAAVATQFAKAVSDYQADPSSYQASSSGRNSIKNYLSSVTVGGAAIPIHGYLNPGQDNTAFGGGLTDPSIASWVADTQSSNPDGSSNGWQYTCSADPQQSTSPSCKWVIGNIGW